MSQPHSQPVSNPKPTISAVSVAATMAPRVLIERVSPSVDFGSYPAKAVVGQPVVVEADIFLDGHEKPAAQILWRSANGESQVVAMRTLGNDRWRAEFTPLTTG